MADARPRRSFLPPRIRVGDLIFACLCLAVSLTVSVLPHVIWWLRLSDPAFFSDWDDTYFYLQSAAVSFFDTPFKVGDPARASGGLSIYPPIQMLPGVWTARALGLRSQDIALVWRVFGGLSIGLAWYLLFRCFFDRPSVSAGLAILPMVDSGLARGIPIVRQWYLAAATLGPDAHARYFRQSPYFLTQWRIVSPSLSLAYLLLHVGSLTSARADPSRTRVVVAGVCFGLLFHAYFFFWTAACLALLMAFLVDPERRRVYAQVGALGGLIGLPAVVSGFLMKQAASPDWAIRAEFFVPISRWSEWNLGKHYLFGLAFSLFVMYWAIRRRRDLVPLASLTLAGVLMENHQVVTGLQLQNWHYNFVWCPLMYALIVTLLGGALNRANLHRVVLGGLWAVVIVLAGLGVWLRIQESTRSEATRENMAGYARYRDQRLSTGVPLLAPRSVIAGDDAFAAFATISENLRPLFQYSVELSPSVSDDELALRLVLNHFLKGSDRADFEVFLNRRYVLGAWGLVGRDPQVLVEWKARLLTTYDRVASDPWSALDRCSVRYLALPAGQRPPSYMGARWSLIQTGPHWRIWEWGRAERDKGDR
jgi:hypothetical protein